MGSPYFPTSDHGEFPRIEKKLFLDVMLFVEVIPNLLFICQLKHIYVTLELCSWEKFMVKLIFTEEIKILGLTF